MPRLGKIRQPRCDLLGSGRLVHELQISSDLFALFPRDIIEAVTHYLDDAQLHLSLGKNRFDRLWKTACSKSLIQKDGKPYLEENGRRPCRGSATVLGAQGVPVFGPGAINVSVFALTRAISTAVTPPTDCRVVLGVSALGYGRIRRTLAKEGRTVSHKQVQRIRRREECKVQPKPKKIPRCGAPNQAEHRHHVWTWDFILDHTDTGGKFKMLPLLDQYTRQCLTIRVERHITSAHVLEVLEKAMIQYGLPSYIRSDNGSEFIATKVQQWLKDHHIKTI